MSEIPMYPDECPNECKVCGEDYTLEDGYEDTGFFHGCAQDIAEHASEQDVERARERLKAQWGVSSQVQQTHEKK